MVRKMTFFAWIFIFVLSLCLLITAKVLEGDLSEPSNTIIEQLETASETIESNDQKILEFEINKKEKSQVQENIDKEKQIEEEEEKIAEEEEEIAEEEKKKIAPEEEEKITEAGEENYLFESLTKEEKKEIQEKRSQLLAEDEESFEEKEEEEKMKAQTKLEKRKARAQNRANQRNNRRSKTKKKKNNNPFGDLNFDHLMDKMKDFDFNNMKMPENMDMNSMKDTAEQFGMDPKLLDNINMDKMKDFDFSNMKMPENMNSMKDMAKQFGMDPKLLDNINMDDVQNAMKGGFNKDDMKKKFDQYKQFGKQQKKTAAAPKSEL